MGGDPLGFPGYVAAPTGASRCVDRVAPAALRVHRGPLRRAGRVDGRGARRAGRAGVPAGGRRAAARWSCSPRPAAPGCRRAWSRWSRWRGRRRRPATTRRPGSCRSPSSATRRPAACSRPTARSPTSGRPQPGATVGFAGPRVVEPTGRRAGDARPTSGLVDAAAAPGNAGRRGSRVPSACATCRSPAGIVPAAYAGQRRHGVGRGAAGPGARPPHRHRLGRRCCARRGPSCGAPTRRCGPGWPRIDGRARRDRRPRPPRRHGRPGPAGYPAGPAGHRPGRPSRAPAADTRRHAGRRPRAGRGGGWGGRRDRPYLRGHGRATDPERRGLCRRGRERRRPGPRSTPTGCSSSATPSSR